MFVKTEDIDIMNASNDTSQNIFERKPFLDTESHIHSDYLSINSDNHGHNPNQNKVEKSRLENYLDKISNKNKKVLAIVLSIFCGIMTGTIINLI